MPQGIFIVIDGGEGTGTTTMSKHVVEQIKLCGGKAYWTREPGGSVFGEAIRELILGPGGKEADAETLFALFWAARRDHTVKKIRPYLEEGATVVCDRFDSSTWAYQIRGQEQPQLRQLFMDMRGHYLRGLLPDRYIILDAPPGVSIARTKARQGVPSHFDERDMDFHHRVRKGFLEFGRIMDCTTLNAALPREAVETMVLEAIEPLL